MALHHAGRLLLLLLALTTLGSAGSSDNDSSDNEDCNEKTEEHAVEVVPGKKEGTPWLIVDLEYICVKNDESESESKMFLIPCISRRPWSCCHMCSDAGPEARGRCVCGQYVQGQRGVQQIDHSCIIDRP